jgi:hypothetical protein
MAGIFLAFTHRTDTRLRHVLEKSSGSLWNMTWIHLGAAIALVSEDRCLGCSACACMSCVVLQRCTLPQDSWSAAAKPGFDALDDLALCCNPGIKIK